MTTVRPPESCETFSCARSPRTMDGRSLAVRCPVELVWGDDDTAVPLAVGQRLQDELAQTHLVICPGAGHLTPLTAPGRARARDRTAEDVIVATFDRRHLRLVTALAAIALGGSRARDRLRRPSVASRRPARALPVGRGHVASGCVGGEHAVQRSLSPRGRGSVPVLTTAVVPAALATGRRRGGRAGRTSVYGVAPSRLAWTRRMSSVAVVTVGMEGLAVALARCLRRPLGQRWPRQRGVRWRPRCSSTAALAVLTPVEDLLAQRHVGRASAVLARVRPLVVGITGSYGKTTTKTYVAHLLARRPQRRGKSAQLQQPRRADAHRQRAPRARY